jgi:hypothetical protein
VSWRLVPLPLPTMLWNPTARFGGKGDVVASPVFPSAFEKLKAIVGYTGAEMDVQLQKHGGRPDPDSEEGLALKQNVLYDFGAYTVSAFMRISSLWETFDDA